MDSRDFKIIELLSIYGPRNLSQIVKNSGMPKQTAYKRIKDHLSPENIKIELIPNYKALGLKNIILFCETLSPELLQTQALRNVMQCLGYINGYYLNYTLKKDSELLKHLKNKKLTGKFTLYEANTFHNTKTSNNKKTNKKIFYDHQDLFILEEIKQNPRVYWKELAGKWKEKHNESLSTESISKRIGYRYKSRVEKLICGYYVKPKLKGFYDVFCILHTKAEQIFPHIPPAWYSQTNNYIILRLYLSIQQLFSLNNLLSWLGIEKEVYLLKSMERKPFYHNYSLQEKIPPVLP